MAGGELQAILSASRLFGALGERELGQLASIAHRKRVGAGEVVFLRGQPAATLYGVVRGQVKIVSTAPDGREMILRLLDGGDTFGELALLDGGARTATAIAAREGELLVIERSDFESLMRRQPEIAIALLALVARRLRSTTDQLSDTSFLPLAPRLAKKLLELAASYGRSDGGGTRIRISQEELGNLVSTSRVSVNQQLKAWERDGLVRTSRGAVTVLDRAALEGAASV